MRVFASVATRNRTLVHLVTGAFVLAGGGAVALWYAPWLGDPVRLRAIVDDAGPFGPVVFVLFAALQVLVAPIPGHVLGFLGGVLFGAMWGTVYSVAGVVLGSTAAFALARRYGRPYVERSLSSTVIDRFDGYVGRAGVPGLLLVFLLPGLPDDAVCFLAGLTRVPLRTLVLLALVGRTPAFVVVAVAGDGVATGRAPLAVALLTLFVALSAVGFLRRGRILAFLRARIAAEA